LLWRVVVMLVLPADLAAFLQTTIKSVWALELLLLLRRHRDKRWGIEALIHELRASTAIVAAGLAALAAARIVEESDFCFRYRPATPELDALAQRLEQAYAQFPVAVTNAILAAPDHKMHIFADAFRLKKKKKE
jgi:hypothetical protein